MGGFFLPAQWRRGRGYRCMSGDGSRDQCIRGISGQLVQYMVYNASSRGFILWAWGSIF